MVHRKSLRYFCEQTAFIPQGRKPVLVGVLPQVLKSFRNIPDKSMLVLPNAMLVFTQQLRFSLDMFSNLAVTKLLLIKKTVQLNGFP